MSRRLTLALYAVCGLLVAADLLYHKHAHFATDGTFGFYGFYGLVAGIGFVLAARAVGAVLVRREDYYDGE